MRKYSVRVSYFTREEKTVDIVANNEDTAIEIACTQIEDSGGEDASGLVTSAEAVTSGADVVNNPNQLILLK